MEDTNQPKEITTKFAQAGIPQTYEVVINRMSSFPKIIEWGSYPAGTTILMKISIRHFDQLITGKWYNIIINGQTVNTAINGPSDSHVYHLTMP
jgi:hypothetical protein